MKLSQTTARLDQERPDLKPANDNASRNHTSQSSFIR